MKWTNLCIYCQGTLYHLKEGMLKCSQCKRKYSPEKTNKIITLIYAFCNEESAHHSAKRLHLSYTSVQHYFEQFRYLCAKICEREYEQVRALSCEYEEYFYLERSKRQDKNAVFDAQNFLTFDYNGHIYNIVMPSLQKYKEQFVEDNLEDVYADGFSKFKRKSRIIKLSSHHNKIVTFWDFLEISILHYKGIKHTHFPLFLKEMEFKYNHSMQERLDLMQDYFFIKEQ